MPRVLVTDASERAALAVIRSLGKKGIDVTAGDDTAFNAGSLSRYCKRRILYPSPQKDYRTFLEYMLALVKKEKYDLIIPLTDFTTLPLSKHKEDFEPHVKVAAPPYDLMIKTYDKALTMQIAAEHSIPHPKTLILESVEDVKRVSKEIGYPVVIKPRTKVMWIDGSAILMKITQRNYAYSPEDLVTKYRKIVLQNECLVKRDYLPMIQEYVQGTGYGVETLFHSSKPKALFIHRRLREYPTTGGASTLRISVRNEELRDLAVKILKVFNWHGVAMVEFKVNRPDTEPKLIEINGRFWGSLPLAIASGVDFPYMLYKMMMEEVVIPQLDYKIGIRKRWFLPGDLLWLLSSFMGNAKKLHALNEFFRTLNVPDDVFSISDPLPTIGAIGTAIEQIVEVVSGQRNIYGEIFNR